MNIENIFLKKESIEILKILALINNIEKHNRIYIHVWKKYKSRLRKTAEIRIFLFKEIN